jgi:hypothetical protein
MIVYSLLGFNDYEGSDLVGVFHRLVDLQKVVQDGKWYFDDMGFVESRLGEKIDDVLGRVEYVLFTRYNGEVREVN